MSHGTIFCLPAAHCVRSSVALVRRFCLLAAAAGAFYGSESWRVTFAVPARSNAENYSEAVESGGGFDD